MEKIILDTNFLMIPGQFGLDIFKEIEKLADFNYRLYILDLSIEELQKILKEAKEKDKKSAKIALALLKRKNIKIIRTKTKEFQGLYADDVLVRLSKDHIIATLDKDLKRKIKGKKIIFRQKKYLTWSA